MLERNRYWDVQTSMEIYEEWYNFHNFDSEEFGKRTFEICHKIRPKKKKKKWVAHNWCVELRQVIHITIHTKWTDELRENALSSRRQLHIRLLHRQNINIHRRDVVYATKRRRRKMYPGGYRDFHKHKTSE